LNTTIEKISADKSIAIIACQIMESEVEAVKQTDDQLQAYYLDQGLHRTPAQMAGEIQGIIDRIDDTVDKIVLGYGLCSNGIVGVKARTNTIIVPLCHDCIGFFLGSPQAYLNDFYSRPGSYYLTPGWIAERKDPLGIIEDDYVPRYGREMAEWAKKEELKHYTHIVLIDTGVADLEPMRKVGMKNAEYFGMEYLEIQGRSREFFKKLMYGPYPDDEFVRLLPGNEITQDMFIG
jgi:hypothetical protein